MDQLLDAAVALVRLVSPEKIRMITSSLRGVDSADSAPTPNRLADTAAARAAIRRLTRAWSHVQASGDEVAGILMGASASRERAEREQSIELVWTGPTTRFVPTRRTEQVLHDLVASARHDLFLVSFVAYHVRSVLAAINEASSRGVRVRFLLEASTSRGGSLTYDPTATMRVNIPNAELFGWQARQEPFVGGKVHAKVAVVDAARVFITSANLTDHALEKNMEAGVLINGGQIPPLITQHFEALITVGVVVPV